MTTIYVCMGQRCQLRGAALVAHAFRQGLALRGWEGQVSAVSGDYCQHRCEEGVIVRIGDQFFTRVTASQVPDILEKCLHKEGL